MKSGIITAPSRFSPACAFRVLLYKLKEFFWTTKPKLHCIFGFRAILNLPKSSTYTPKTLKTESSFPTLPPSIPQPWKNSPKKVTTVTYCWQLLPPKNLISRIKFHENNVLLQLLKPPPSARTVTWHYKKSITKKA